MLILLPKPKAKIQLNNPIHYQRNLFPQLFILQFDTLVAERERKNVWRMRMQTYKGGWVKFRVTVGSVKNSWKEDGDVKTYTLHRDTELQNSCDKK